MSANRHLQPLQFKLRPDMTGEDYHLLEAHHPEHGIVGGMSWARKDTGFHQAGEISNIYVHNYPKNFRRQGIATAMYKHAVDSGIEPSPLHSYTQSQTGGEAWAKKVGGPYAPKRYANGPDA